MANEAGCARDAAGDDRVGAVHVQAEQVLDPVVGQHVAQFGWNCPGFNCPPHPSRDLTADHIVPVVQGGDEEGELRVLCRSCNPSDRDTRLQPTGASTSRKTLEPQPGFSRNVLQNVQQNDKGPEVF